MPSRSPYKVYGFALCAATLTLTVAIAAMTGLSYLAGYLIAINGVTFASYGFDKSIAGTSFTRIPEKVLHGLAIAGATPGAWLGQRAFRHKTAKSAFQRWFWLIAALQIGLVAYVTFG